MKKFWLLLICFITVQWTYAQSTITINSGSSISVGNGSIVYAGYRDGTMTNNGYFNSRSITFDPVATAATSVTQTSFNANWNVSSGANGYKLDVSTVSNFSSFVTGYQNLDVGSVFIFPVSSNLSTGSTYYYRVRAYDIDGITGYSNVIAVVMAPSNPVATAATNITDVTLRANWNSVTGATGYRLDVSTTSEFTAGTFVAGFENKDVGNVTNYSITGLSGNTTYYYKIKAYNGSGTSNSSNTITALTAPAAPTAAAAGSITQTSFIANWTVPVGATKYYLDVSTAANFGTFVTGYQNLDVGGGTTYSINTNITAGTTYYYRLRASNGTSTGSNSNVMDLITIPPNPTTTAASNILTTSFDANWSASTGASGYRLYVSNNSLFRAADAVTDYWDKDVGNVLTSSVNTNLSAGTNYYYKVRAYNAGGTSDSSGTITVLTIPAAPTATNANPISQTSFTANWGASTGATKYYLDVSTDVNFGTFVTGYQNKDVGGVTSTIVSTADPTLTAGTTYHYRVRAYNATGTSANSNTVTLITVPPNPTSTSATNITEVSFSANWNSSLSALGYIVDVSTDAEFDPGFFVPGFEEENIGNVTTCSVTGLLVNTTYYFRVRAYNVSGTSGNSGTITQTTAPDVPTAGAALPITQTSFTANWSEPAGATGYRLDVATNPGFTTGTFVTGYQNLDVGNTATYSVNTNITEGTAYFYRVRAYSANGTSTSSNTISLITVPGNPIATTATTITTTGFYANWNASANAEEYLLDVATDNTFTGFFVDGYNSKPVAGLSSEVTGITITAGTRYYYRVRAKNSSGESGNSGIITVLTTPAKPTLNIASSVGEIKFTASWAPVANASGYLLDVSTASDCETSFVDGYHSFDLGNVNSFIIAGLTGGTTYYYRLAAYNVSGSSSFSDISSVKTLSPAPVALPALPIGEISFTAKWNSAIGADGYLLDVATDDNFTSPIAGYNSKPVAALSDPITVVLSAGTTYYYRVRANNSSGAGSYSNTITVTTLPSAPTGLSFNNLTNNSFSASWNIATGATGYRLSVSKSDFAASDSVTGLWNKNVGNVTTYSVTGLEENTTYYFQVKAYNNSGASANSASANPTPTTTKTTPGIPSVKPATSIEATSFIANWNAAAGAEGYKLDVSLSSVFATYVLEDQSVAGLTYPVPGLTAGATYFYQVRATNASGTSGNSNTVSVKTKPLAPTAVAADNIAATNFDAKWEVSNGATGYYLDVATDSDFLNPVAGFNNRDIGNNLTYTVTGLTGNTVYHYRVRAYNTGGISGNSGTIDVTTAVGGTVIATAATSITGTSFYANWEDYDAGVTSYILKVGTTPGGTEILNQNVAKVVTYLVEGLTPGTTYYYQVESNGVVGTSGIINVLTLPAPPTSGSATNVTEISFTANWTASDGATGYYLDVSTTSTFDAGTFVTGFGDKYVNNVTAYTVTGLTAGTTYCYRVRAKNGSGTNDINSTSQTVSTLTHKPTASNATTVTKDSFTANWTSTNGNATSYQIDVSTAPDCESSLIRDNTPVVGQTYYDLSGLSSGTTYYYRVYAYNGSSLSSASNIITVLTKPSAPNNLTTSLEAKTSFTASWDVSTGATKYYLDVATNAGFTGSYVEGYQNLDVGNSTSLSITGLARGTTYHYRVRAFNTSGTSDNSGVQTALTFPAEPTIQSATGIQSSGFTANWIAVTSATGYYLDAATTSNFAAGTFVLHDEPVAAIFRVVSGLTEKNYYYRVRSYNASGPSDYSGTMSVILVPNAPVANDVNVASITASSFIASWSSSSGADGYKIDVCTNNGFTNFVSGYNNRDVGSATSLTIAGLNSGTTYYYQVRAYSAGRISDNSNPITTLTKPAAPTSTAALLITEVSFTANWNTSFGATKYYLDVATNSSFTNFVAGFNNKDMGGAITSPVTVPSANTNYYYRVRSENSSGISGNSVTITVLTAPAIPVILAATSITNTGFKANWNASAGAAGYRLDVSETSNFLDFVGIYEDKDIGNVTTYSISGLAGSTTYYYRLRAYKATATSGSSGPNNIVTAVNPSGVPTASAATSLAVTSFTANWGVVAGAAGYKLDVSTDWNFDEGTFITDFNNKDVTGANSCSVTGLTGGTTYYYRIRSYNASGTSSSSGIITALTLPIAPTGIVATSLASASFTANWSASPSATKYYIDVSTDEDFTAGNFVTDYFNKDVGNVTSFSINTNLVGGTTYYYRVRAFNASGQSGNSNEISALTIPSAPTSAAANPVSETGFTTNWTSVTGVTGYRLDVSTNSGFGAGTFLDGLHDKDVGNVTTYPISGLTGGTNYYYRIRAYNNSGTSTSSLVITALTAPSVPVATTATLVVGTSFTANWNSVTGATKYYLDVSTNSGFTSFVGEFNNKDVGNLTTYSITGLSVNTTYYYQVRSNNSSGTSGNSNTVTTSTAPIAPTAIDATSSGETSFTANWNSVAGATGYRLDVSTDIGFGVGTFESGYVDPTTGDVTTYEDINVGNKTTYTVTGITSGYTHYYRVRAYNSGATSSNSGTIKVLGVPSVRQATTVTVTSFTANWNSVGGALGYRLDVSTNSEFSAGTFFSDFEDKDVHNIDSIVISGLSPNVTYYYRVRSYDGSGASGNSNVTMVRNLPLPPVAIQASMIKQKSFTANWNASTEGVKGYQLDVAIDEGFTSFVTGYENKAIYNVTSAVVNNLYPGHNYYYRVRAYNSMGPSDNSNTINVVTIPSSSLVISPSGITQTSFTANWNVSSGVTEGYIIDIATDISFMHYITGYSNRDVGNVTSYSLTEGLNPGTNYYCRVRAYNSGGKGDYSNIATVVTIPANPVAKIALNIFSTSFTANWDSVRGATNYCIDVAADAEFKNCVQDYRNKEVGNETSKLVTGLTANTLYYYQVRAGNSSGSSFNSNCVSFRTKSKSPVADSASSITQKSFVANWISSEGGANGYRFDLATDSEFTNFVPGFQDKDVSNTTSILVNTGIHEGVIYYYRVRAYNVGGVSENSNIISLITIPANPTATAATDIQKKYLTANWNASQGAEAYLLDVATDPGFTKMLDEYNCKNIGCETSCSINNLMKSKNYYYRIRALNKSGLSGYSNTVAASTLPNTAPVLTEIEGEPLMYILKGGSLELTATLQILDIDDIEIVSANISISANYQKGEDKLIYNSQNEIAGTWNIENGTLMLSGKAKLSEYISALRNIQYINSFISTTKTNRTISFSVFDGMDNSNVVTREIEMRKINSAPVLSDIETDSIIFKKGSSSVDLCRQIKISDEDNLNLFEGKISFENSYISGEDVLEFSASNNIHGLFDESNGTLTFTGIGNVSEYENVFRSIKYSNAKGVKAKTGTKTITFSVSDGLDVSNILSRNIEIISPVAAPGELKITCNDHAGITLSWLDKCDNEDGFIITRELLPQNINVISDSKIKIDTVGMNVTSFYDSELNEAANYQYSVCSFMLNGALSDLLPENQKTTRAPLKKPDELEAVVNPVGYIELKWIDNSAVEDSISIERSEGDDFHFYCIACVKQNTCSFKDSTVADGKKYFYRVSAKKDTLISTFSNILEVVAIVTDISDELNGIPTNYILYQNYPNPFNPTTTIRYGIPKESLVKIIIYNILGEEIIELKKQIEPAGYYELQFNAGKLSSGIYFCRIEADKYISIKKMLLVK